MTIIMNHPQIMRAEVFEEDYFGDDYYEEQKYGYHYSDGTPILATLIPTPSIAFTSSIDEDVNEPIELEDPSYLTNLSDGSRIPSTIVWASRNWDCALATLKALNEQEKKDAEMAPFKQFNRMTDQMVADEINRRFMATLPTMSKAMKARLVKEAEEELARKNRASDQFYNKGRPGATSHTAWGHKTGGKNKKGLMEKSVEEIASERKLRRLATKAKNDAEELIRAENFKRIAEIKERLVAEEKANEPVIEVLPKTEIQIFRRQEIEACIQKINARVEEVIYDVIVEEKKPVVKWETASKHADKMTKMASSIQQALFGKPVAPTIATGKIGDKGTKMCKSVMSGFKCKYGSACQFAHSVNDLVLVPCRFGQGCKRATCTFAHPKETKDIYCVRVGIDMKKPVSEPVQVATPPLSPVKVSIPVAVRVFAPAPAVSPWKINVPVAVAVPITLNPTVTAWVPASPPVVVVRPTVFEIDKRDLKATMKHILDNKIKNVHIIFKK